MQAFRFGLEPIEAMAGKGNPLKNWKSRAAVFAVAATMAVPVIGLARPAGAAAGGNSANAAACANNGWQILQTSTNGSFKNQGACTSYAAKSGNFSSSCLDSSNPGLSDGRVVGAPNTLNSIAYFNSGDGTCSGGLNAFRNFETLVIANTDADAAAICNSLGATTFHANLSALGYPTPSTWWTCF